MAGAPDLTEMTSIGNAWRVPKHARNEIEKHLFSIIPDHGAQSSVL